MEKKAVYKPINHTKGDIKLIFVVLGLLLFMKTPWGQYLWDEFTINLNKMRSGQLHDIIIMAPRAPGSDMAASSIFSVQ